MSLKVTNGLEEEATNSVEVSVKNNIICCVILAERKVTGKKLEFCVKADGILKIALKYRESYHTAKSVKLYHLIKNYS